MVTSESRKATLGRPMGARRAESARQQRVTHEVRGAFARIEASKREGGEFLTLATTGRQRTCVARLSQAVRVAGCVRCLPVLAVQVRRDRLCLEFL